MLDQAQVNTAYRAIFRVEPNEAQSGFFADFPTLDASIGAMETAAVDTQRAVTFYQTYFDRLPDDAGLDFWTGVIRDNPDAFGDNPAGNQALALEFFNAGEFTALYGSLTTEQTVSALYTNVLGRNADDEGLAFWISVVNEDNGFGLQELGREFAVAPETETTFDPLIEAYLTALGNGDTLPGTDIFDFEETSGTTLNLTTQQDSLVGTDENDVFNAVFDGFGGDTTLTAADMIDGGAGADRLNILDNGFSNLPGFAISNVENFFIRNVNVAATYDFAGVAGEEQVWSDRSVATTDFQNLGTGTVIGLQGDGSTILSSVLADYETSSDAISILIDGGVMQTAAPAAIDVNLSTATSATITSTGGANTVGGIGLGGSITSLIIDAQSDLTIDDGNSAFTSAPAFVSQELFGFDASAANATITVTGSGSVQLGDISSAVDTIDASGNSGGINLINSNGTLVPPGTGSATLDVIGSSADDMLTNNIQLGAGSIDGGAGNDTVAVAAGVITSAADGAKYSNIEILQSNDAVIDLNHISGIQSVVLNDSTTANAGFQNLSVAQAMNVTAKDAEGQISLSVSGADAPGSSSDELRITFDDGDGIGSETITTNAVNPFVDDVETLQLVAVDDILIGSLVNTGSASPLSDVRNFTISGDGDVDISTGAAQFQSGAMMDASALNGTFTFDGSTTGAGNGLSIRGGSSADVLTGTDSGGSGDSIDGNAGDDVITGGTGEDVLIGGAGADTFVFDAGDSGTPSATTFDTISDFEVGSDSIRFTSTLLVDQQNNNASPGTAMIDAFAAATFNPVDDTLNERITAVQNALDTDGSNAGEFAVFENGGNSYVFISDGSGALDGGDVLIEVAGVTELNASTVDGSGDLFLM